MSGFQYLMLGIGALAALGGLAALIQRIRTRVSGRVADAVVVDHKQTTVAMLAFGVLLALVGAGVIGN